ncbi:hypothetical protein EXS61_01615 [Candidatus Parcubacteria bacterium]|nr:hypothetical protein [Candidatus Parcubacteria bacterium]
MKRLPVQTLFVTVFFIAIFYSNSAYSPETQNPTFAQSQITADKIKILVVAGHDNDTWGARFMGVKEVELNRILADYLYDFLKNDPLFEPTRNQENGDYIPELAQYFKDNEAKIVAYRKERRETFNKKEIGLDVDEDEMIHNMVTEDVANNLYGTSMWAEEKDFDVTIHIHFNDYPGRPKDKAGKYRGFVVYAPSTYLKNGEKSIPLARAIYDELAKLQSKSNLPVEKDGLIESNELIALGARNSLSIPSALIEYAYIAEPRLQGAGREKVIREMAQETYVAIKGFYEKKSGKN